MSRSEHLATDRSVHPTARFSDSLEKDDVLDGERHGIVYADQFALTVLLPLPIGA